MKDTKIKLVIKTYKIPIIIDEGKVVEEHTDLSQQKPTRTEEIDLDRATENVTLRIPEISKKAHNYNSRQIKIALETGRDYILKQIVTKK